MRTLHHIGIPTAEPHESENYLAEAKLYVTDAELSPNKIEWLRFEDESPMPGLLKTVPHIAFEVLSVMVQLSRILDPLDSSEYQTAMESINRFQKV